MNRIETHLLNLLHDCCANGPISYRDFIEVVLYGGAGYYRQQRERVGRSPERDLHRRKPRQGIRKAGCDAAEDLLGPEQVANSCFIEIAAEPGRCLLDQYPQHPFAQSRVLRHGDSIEAHGPVVLFANEWLDALPFHRLIFDNGAWRERGVQFTDDGHLQDVLLPQLSPPVADAAARLPTQGIEGYQLIGHWRLSRRCPAVGTGVERIAVLRLRQDWRDLTQSCPAGTAHLS